jgi:hypothetical protein
MTAAPSPWLRADRRATGRLADAMLIAFHRGALRDDVPLDLARFGAPSADAVKVLDIQEHTDAGWIGGWRQGGMRAVAEGQLGDALAGLDQADRCHAVRAMVADPADLTYLQAAWAVARWLVARGAEVVLDVFPLRYLPAAAIAAQDPAAPFDVEREVAVICQADPNERLTGQLVHTRGLGKLGRPDLVAITEPARLRELAEVLGALAARMADGYLPEDGETVEVAGTRVLLVPAPRGSIAEALHLNNDAFLVEPVTGVS